MKKINENTINEKIPFAQKHPRINFMVGLILVAGILLIIIFLILFTCSKIGDGIEQLVDYLKRFVSTTDKVIIVAMITGTVSIIGVVFSSVIAKIIDYRYNVKKYLYDKREVSYEQFISMIYTIIEETKKPSKDRMSELEITKKVSEFSKGLTLWGSNKVVKRWLEYRKVSISNPDSERLLLLLEEIIYEIRRDVGQRKKLGKGDMLSLFINDIEKLVDKRR